ncbi:MAG: hypothetical protein JST73_07005 [Actinobacteria bacterium]|nr:hypothetical protein [Actinomycetota bacterium]
MEREKAIVRAETARRLVPTDELAHTVRRLTSVGTGVEARHVAEFYDVTHSVAHAVLRGLRHATAKTATDGAADVGYAG